MKLKRLMILTGDVLWLLGALGLAVAFRYAGSHHTIDFGAHFHKYFLVALPASVAWGFLYFEMSLDGFKGGWQLPAILSKLIVAVALLMVVVSAFAFLTNNLYSRLVLLYFGTLFLLGLMGLRCLVRSLFGSHPRNVEYRSIIVGNGRVAQELARKLLAHPEMPFEVLGFLFPSESESANGYSSPPEHPATRVKTLQALDLLTQLRVQRLIVAMPYPNGAELRKLIAECQKASIQVFLVPELYDLYLSQLELVQIDDLPLISLQERRVPEINFAIKRVIDVVFSVGILVAVSPVLAVAAAVVYVKKSKAIRTEVRCGQDGVPFRMYRLNIDRHTRDTHSYERLFVRWSLTELPQLWNVLRGDMSLVGPRPESPERVNNYSDWQAQRLKVRAGVTGLAQVHGLREQHSSEEKTRFDLQYICNWSPLLDLGLLLQTVWTLLSRGLNQDAAFSEGSSVHKEGPNLLKVEVADANRS